MIHSTHSLIKHIFFNIYDITFLCICDRSTQICVNKIMRNPSRHILCSRYLAVTQPLIYSRRRRSKRLAGVMIVAVWIMAGAITSPPLLGCFPRATNRDVKKCSYNMDSSYVIFSAMGSFFLPMLVMLYVYGRISCVIASRHRNLETSNEVENVRSRRKITVRITWFSLSYRRDRKSSVYDQCYFLLCVMAFY